MRRAAALALALAAAPAGAMEPGECDGLLARMGWTAETVATPGGACFLQGVAPEGGGWRARIVALMGDVDALPDAAPSRLTGGVWGLARDGEAETDAITATFDLASGGGAVRVDRLALGRGIWRADLSARLEGMPEVWPAEPGALSGARLAALEGAAWTEGEALPGDAKDALARRAGPWLEALALGGGPDAGPGAAALRDALPLARGRVEVAIGEAGLALPDLLPLLRGGLGPAEAAALAARAGLALDWAPDAP